MSPHEWSIGASKIGVVLPGGGARGSYQAGSAAYLAEWAHANGKSLEAIAGSGVGAINAAILAGAPDLREGAARLQRMWAALGSLPEAQLQIFRALPGFGVGTLISLLAGSGQTSPLDRLLRQFGDLALQPGRRLPWVAGVIMESLKLEPQLRENRTMGALLDELLRGPYTRRSPRLYVSVYESDGALVDLARLALATFSIVDSKSSRLLDVSTLAPPQQREAVLAAAAIPLLFDAREVSGLMISGEFGQWRSQQGRVPARELCEREGVGQLFVLHSSDGSLWDRSDPTLPSVTEVRPSEALGTGNVLQDMAIADGRTIEQRFRQGYADAKRAIGNVEEVGLLVDRSRTMAAERDRAVDDLERRPPRNRRPEHGAE